jgi:hypothetical protein
MNKDSSLDIGHQQANTPAKTVRGWKDVDGSCG